VDIAHRVVARYIARTADAESGLERQLESFESLVEALAKNEQDVLDKPDDWNVQVEASAAVGFTFRTIKRYGLELLFLGILKNYRMGTRDRQTIERATKTFTKNKMNRIRTHQAVAVYEKFLATMRSYLEAAKKVIASGKLHADEGADTKMKAGPFTLINTGGFSEEKMEEAAKVVEKAAKLLKSKGLGKVCYGDIQVTNTVKRSTRVLAFYMIHKDELYIRANLRGKQGPAVESVVHELGHRLHYKFLRSKDKEIQGIYAALKDDDERVRWKLREDPDLAPKIGVTISEKGSTYVVTGIGYRGNKPMIELALESDPSYISRVSFENWYNLQNQNKGAGSAFVSPYAKTKYEENFAEMIAHYCHDTLPDDQVEMLETVL